MPDPQIRRLVTADLPAYKVLRDAVLTASPTAFSSDAEPERAPEIYRPRLGGNTLVDRTFTLGAWQGASLVGAVTCECDARPKVRHIGHLVGMMVWAEARGAGVGKALLAACIAEARTCCALELLTLSVTAGNEPAEYLYERAGFVRYGRLQRAICVDGAYHAKDQMSLTL